jgi:hypothetical protein
LESKQSDTPAADPLGDVARSRRNPIAPPPSPEAVTKPNASDGFHSDPPSPAATSENNAQKPPKLAQDDRRNPSSIEPERPGEIMPPATTAPTTAPTIPNRAITSSKVNQSRSVQSADLDRSRSPVNLPAPQVGIVATTSNIQITSIETTLSDDIKISLSRYIKTTSLSDKASGEAVFDISLNRGEVLQVKLDESATTLKNTLVVENIRRSLLNWQAPTSASGKIRLRLSMRASSR